LTAFTDSYEFIINGFTNLEYHYVLPIISDSYSLSGTDSNLEYHYALDGVSGTHVTSGTTANLEYNRIFGVDTDSYSLSGSETVLDRGYPTSSGSLSLVGTEATLSTDSLQFGVVGLTIQPDSTELSDIDMSENFTNEFTINTNDSFTANVASYRITSSITPRSITITTGDITANSVGTITGAFNSSTFGQYNVKYNQNGNKISTPSIENIPSGSDLYSFQAPPNNEKYILYTVEIFTDDDQYAKKVYRQRVVQTFGTGVSFVGRNT
jgi:hypothetical protein